MTVASKGAEAGVAAVEREHKGIDGVRSGGVVVYEAGGGRDEVVES